MKIQKYSVLNRVKKLKIPNKANRYSNIIFGCLTSEIEVKKHAFHAKVSFQEQKKEDRKLWRRFKKDKWNEILGILKDTYKPNEVAKFSKNRRRKIRKTLNEFERRVFNHYCKTCKHSAHRVINVKNRRVKRRTTYTTFINSVEWAEIRNRFWRTHPRRCAICNTAKHIHLHHMVYTKFGSEKDEDLIALCESHHEDYHAKNGTQRNMKIRTMQFVETKKQQHSLS